jgi:hypothetical protein
VLLVHRVSDVPRASRVAETWQLRAREAGLPGLHLVAAETRPGADPRRYGFDAAAEFPPVGSNTAATALTRPVKQLNPHFRGRLLSYERMAHRFMSRRRPRYVLHRGVTPGWDNTARRGVDATIYVGSSPHIYGRWLATAREDERRRHGSAGLVFVNAWNEWAEGAYLEPDRRWNGDYLRATRWGAEVEPVIGPLPSGRWTVPHARSLLLLVAGSLLSSVRRLTGLLHRARR